MPSNIHEEFERENWRRENFERLGFRLFDAATLAEKNEVDYHDVEKFLAQHPSCSPETALEIVR